MIDFRYHVVSIVAVFLALALGLFIGSTSLREPVANDIQRRTTTVANDNTKLKGQVGDLQTQLQDGQQFDAALEPYAVNGRLAGQSVMVVSAPGVDDSLRKALVQTITDAGATVTGDIRLKSALLDPAQEEFLTTLTARLHVPGRKAPQGTGAQRAAAQLAEVIATKPGARPVSTNASASVLSAYADGQLLTVAGGTARPGSLAVVIAAAPTTGADQRAVAASNATLLALAQDLDQDAVGAAIVGPAGATDSGGLLAAAAADGSVSKSVSTVDQADLPSGRIATVFALAEQALGQSGSYGPDHSPPLPTPSPTS